MDRNLKAGSVSERERATGEVLGMTSMIIRAELILGRKYKTRVPICSINTIDPQGCGPKLRIRLQAELSRVLYQVLGIKPRGYEPAPCWDCPATTRM